MGLHIWIARAARLTGTVAIAVLAVGIALRVAEASRLRHMKSSLEGASIGRLRQPAMTSLASYPRVAVTGTLPTKAPGQLAIAVASDCVLCGQALRTLAAMAEGTPERFRALTLILVNVDGRASIGDAAAVLARAGVPHAVVVPASTAAFVVRTGIVTVPSLVANGDRGGCTLSGTVSTESLDKCVDAALGKRPGLFVQHGGAGVLLAAGALAAAGVRQAGGLREAVVPDAAAIATIPQDVRTQLFGTSDGARRVTVVAFVGPWGAGSKELLQTVETVGRRESTKARIVVVRLDSGSKPSIEIGDHAATIKGYDSVLASAFGIDKLPTTVVMKPGASKCLRAPGLLSVDELVFAIGNLAGSATGGP